MHVANRTVVEIVWVHIAEVWLDLHRLLIAAVRVTNHGPPLKKLLLVWALNLLVVNCVRVLRVWEGESQSVNLTLKRHVGHVFFAKNTSVKG